MQVYLMFIEVWLNFIQDDSQIQCNQNPNGILICRDRKAHPKTHMERQQLKIVLKKKKIWRTRNP